MLVMGIFLPGCATWCHAGGLSAGFLIAFLVARRSGYRAPILPWPLLMGLLSLAPAGREFLSTLIKALWIGALALGPPTPHTGDASQRRGFAEEEDILTGTALKLLAMLLSGPAIPALPPCGCYGGLLVSSAISEGLGLQAAEAAKAAAEGHGDKPVKVLLPRYPDLPGLVGDHTKPAKLPDPDAPVPSAPPTPGPWPPTPPGPPLVLPPPGAAMPPPVVPRPVSVQTLEPTRAVEKFGTGVPPTDEVTWAREEKRLFGANHVVAGINFSKYDNIEVTTEGGTGREQAIKSFQEACDRYKLPDALTENLNRPGIGWADGGESATAGHADQADD
eukprot:g7287.t1